MHVTCQGRGCDQKHLCERYRQDQGRISYSPYDSQLRAGHKCSFIWLKEVK